MSKVARILTRLVRWSLLATGVLTIVLGLWLASGRRTPLERLVQESSAPQPAAAIICVTGGLGGHRLPTEEGWHRVYTAVQLLGDGLAPVIVFSGGGAGVLSEAEVYAEAARWFGAPADALVLDPVPGNTAEHPRNLLGLEEVRITRDTPLLVVTSPLHSKRTSMVFRKPASRNCGLLRRTRRRVLRLPAARERRRFRPLRPTGRVTEIRSTSCGGGLTTLSWRFEN